MADGTDEPTQPIKNDTPPTTTTPPETTPPAAPKTFDESYVRDLRAEAAKHRKEFKAAQAKLAELETAQAAAETAELEKQGQWKTLAEQNAARTAELEAQLAKQAAAIKTSQRDTLAVSIASQLGAFNPADANFQQAVSSIDIEAADAEAQIRQALEALKAGPFSYLFGTPKPNLAAFNPGGDPQAPPKETREKQKARLEGRGQSKFFDVPTIEARGGGVVGRRGKPKSE